MQLRLYHNNQIFSPKNPADKVPIKNLLHDKRSK